jgi:uncharacterized protein YebE (UPF0316 family)
METLFASAWGPLLIAALRIVDVSLTTLRTVLTIRGRKVAVAAIGFCEVLVWIFAVGNAMKFLDSPLHLLGYATGFALGTYTGLTIEEKLAIGVAQVRIVSLHSGVEIAEALRGLGFGVTEFAGYGLRGNVEVALAVCRRKDVPAVLAEIGRWDPDAFVTVEEPRHAQKPLLRHASQV